MVGVYKNYYIYNTLCNIITNKNSSIRGGNAVRAILSINGLLETSIIGLITPIVVLIRGQDPGLLWPMLHNTLMAT